MDLDMEKLLAAQAVLIAGPTASGKSALALDMAAGLERAGRRPVIVNADSMQVYSDLSILTARPEPAEEARFPHRLYGHVRADRLYSTGQWLRDVQDLLALFCDAGQTAIITGGTGLYFRALTEGFAAIPEIPDPVRTSFRQKYEDLGLEDLHRELVRRDPLAAAAIKTNDAQRILRALEVLEATGKSIVTWQSEQGAEPVLPAEKSARYVIQPDRARLYQRIEDRFDRMVDGGALAEARRFIDLGLDPDLPAMKAIGIREFGAVFTNQISLEEAAVQAKTRTRQYAKRQMTWMRNQMADWSRIET
jgi:tRNA dimethylallyltransferase